MCLIKWVAQIPWTRRHATYILQKMLGKVGNEVTTLIKHCSSSSLPDGLNHTNLVLIPKVKDPSRPVDYRPIALCNILYKIVVKIIAQRLKPLLDNLVDKSSRNLCQVD